MEVSAVVTDRSTHVARAGAATAAALGALGLVGWWLEIPALESGMPGFVTMKPSAALALMFAGTALWLLATPTRRSATLARVTAVLCGAIGVTAPGRMAGTTAGCFVGIGVALLGLAARPGILRTLGAWLLAGTLTMPAAVLVGYVYQLVPLTQNDQTLQMALPTAVGLLALGVGALAAWRDLRLWRLLRSHGPGGVLSRRLLPLALLAPIALGLTRRTIERAGLLRSASASGMATIVMIALLGWVAWRTARDLDAQHAALEAANRELDAARRAAEAANRAKSEFLSRMSHELRTPLNSVIGFSGVLLRNDAGNQTPSDLHQLSRIRANGRHLLDLISEILDLARVEAGRLEAHWETVALGPLIDETVSELQGRALDGSNEMTAHVPVTLTPLVTDATKLKQMLINLIGNALKFTDRGRVMVRVVANPADHRPVRIDVVDDGVGIPPERLKTIFEAFEQGEPDIAMRYGGTGLGLAITRAFAELLGYRIAVRSTPGAGSVFSILLDPAQVG